MSIGNFTELKSSVTSWMARSNLSGQAEDFIMLGESGLNRELGPIELDTTLTGTVGSRSIDISALKCIDPMSLFLVQPGLEERQILKQADGTFPYRDTTGTPRIWAVEGENIDFDCKLDTAYSFRFHFKQRFALSESVPTNWLLTNHPDVYLAACLVWGGLFTKNPAQAAIWKQVLDVGIPQVRWQVSQKHRAPLRVDPALGAIGREGMWADLSEELPSQSPHTTGTTTFDRSGNLTTGGVPQTLAEANPHRISIEGQNNSSESIWLEENGLDAEIGLSTECPAGSTFIISSHARISVIGPTTGQYWEATELTFT